MNQCEHASFVLKGDIIYSISKDEMKNFIDMNPGLESRIGYYLNYEDYTKEELLSLIENVLQQPCKNEIIECLSQEEIQDCFAFC